MHDEPGPAPPTAPALVAVLAGGRGSRIGGAKGARLLAGRPLAAWGVAAARSAGLDVVVVARQETELPDELGAPVVREPWATSGYGPHPLRGVLSALGAARGRAVVALAADLPLVPPALLAALAARPGGAVCAPRGRLHPLCARYAPAAAGPLAAGLARDPDVPAARLLGTLAPEVLGDEWLAGFGPVARTLLDVNRPADLAEAERLLAAGA